MLLQFHATLCLPVADAAGLLATLCLLKLIWWELEMG